MKAATATKKTAPPPAPAVRQVRAVVVCRPPIAHNLQRLGGDAAAAAGTLAEVDILPADDVPPDAPDADLLRYIAVGKEREHTVRLPVYGYRGGGDAAALCDREVAPLLARLLAGESSALIAYGQTGSGKSYTMGTEEYGRGQAPAPHSVGTFCARRVFELARERGVRDLEVSVAAVEIYREGKDKERLFDLQTPERRRIESFESQVSWLRVASPEELQRKLVEAACVRNTDHTHGNARSSRSHAIFVTQVQFKRQQEEGGGVQRIKARLMLVDLAGSERASLAAANSMSQKQGCGINMGLLYLGMILKELSERGATLNYRLSVLTEILKPALGGGANELTSACNTLVVGCISPLAVHAVNTRSTLEFVEQAGTVKNLVRPDVQMMRQQELEAQLEYLQKKVQQLELERQQRASFGSAGVAASPGGSPSGTDEGAGHTASPLPEGTGAPGEEQRPGSAGRGTEAEAGSAAAAAAAAALAAAEERNAALERELAAVRREAVEQRDRAEAYAAQLYEQAAAAADAAPGAMQAAMPAEAASAAGGATPGAAQPGTAPAGATPAAAGRPSAAAFLAAASPLLAASRSVADWKADAAAAEEATPAGQRLPLLCVLPGAEEVVCARDSHMSPGELAALKGKVDRILTAAQDGDDRTQAHAFAEACLYALGAYNKCLGDAITRAEDVEEDAAAERRQAAAEFDQVFEEKSTYMRRASAAEVGLSQYEQQVEDLQCQLAAAQEVLRQAQQQTTPNRWGTIRQLITGSAGASPAPARSAGTADSRRTSHSDSPAGSPRASLPGAPPGIAQPLFGSPSRLGQPPRSGSGAIDGEAKPAVEAPAQGAASDGEAAPAAAAPVSFPAASAAAEEQRLTVGCLRASSSRQDEAAAAAALQAAVACKQRAAAGVLAKLSPSPPGQAKGKPAQAQQADAQQAQHDQLIKAVTAPGIPAQPWGASSAAVSPSVPPSSTQQGAAQATEVDEPSGDYSLQQGPQREQASLQSAAPASFGALAGAAAVEGAPPVVLEQEQQIENMEQDAQAPLDSPMVPCLLGARSAPSPCAEQQHPQSALQPLHDLGAQRQEPIECEEQQAASQQEQQHGQEEQRPQHEQQQPQQPQQQQPQQPQQPPHEGMQQAPSLPGPAISVELAAVGRRRGRGKPPAQEYDFCTSDGTFVDSGSGKPANPLAGLALPAGEPWQRHVLLKGSAITLEQWQARRMLRRGRCHFCCREAPGRRCRHPEAAFGELELCASCHAQLEPDTWRTGESWVSEDPEDPGFNWCLLCGGTGVGGTDKLVMCTVCKVHGFCSGCIWRFTADDVAAAQHGAAWECMLCRPRPKLHLAYIEQQAGSHSTSSAPCSGSSGCEADAERAAAVAAGLRRSTRQRSAARPQQQQQQRAAGSESDSSVIVLLTDSEAGELTDAESAEEVRPARVRSHGRRQPPGSARRPAGAAQQATGTAPRRQLSASNAEAATPAELAGPAAQHPAGEIQLGAAQQAGRTGRKRHRRLLPQRDIQSPTVDEEAQHMRRMLQQRQQRQQQLGAGRSQLQALQRSQRQSQEDRLRKLLL